MRAAQIPSNKHDIDWCKWNRQLLKIMSFSPPLLSPLYRWSASSPATTPFKTSRSPRWSATASPSSGREITTATIFKYDVQLHSCSESGVLWIGANLIGYYLVGGRSGCGRHNNSLHVCNFSYLCFQTTNPARFRVNNSTAPRTQQPQVGRRRSSCLAFHPQKLQYPLRPSD